MKSFIIPKDTPTFNNFICNALYKKPTIPAYWGCCAARQIILSLTYEPYYPPNRCCYSRQQPIYLSARSRFVNCRLDDEAREFLMRQGVVIS